MHGMISTRFVSFYRRKPFQEILEVGGYTFLHWGGLDPVINRFITPIGIGL